MNWLIFIIASSCVAIGFCHAMFLNWRRRQRAIEAVEKQEAEAAEAAKAEVSVTSDQVVDFFESLSELTEDLNVDRHLSKVARISDEIELDDGGDSAFLLSAARKLIDANKELQSDLDDAKCKIQNQRLQIDSYMSEARTDELTGLANRRAFDEELERRLAQWNRQAAPVSLLMLDIDFFKRFNDDYGHQAGDETLQLVAETLNQTKRDMDMAARYGGEEFAIILPGTSVDEAKSAAERIRQAVREATVKFDDNVLTVTVSIGLAQALEGENNELIIKRADTGLYSAKAAGRDCCHVHDGISCRPIAKTSLAMQTT